MKKRNLRKISEKRKRRDVAMGPSRKRSGRKDQHALHCCLCGKREIIKKGREVGVWSS